MFIIVLERGRLIEIEFIRLDLESLDTIMVRRQAYNIILGVGT